MASPIKQLLSPKVLTPLLKSASTLHADSLFKNISRNEAKPLNFEKPIQTTPIKARASVPPGCVIGLTVRNEKGEYLLINTPNKNILLNNGLYTKHNITVLGKGSFGVVVKGIYRDEQVAVKIVKLHNSSTLNEKNALHLAHENIVKVVDVILNPNGNYGIVLMEYIKSAQSLQSIMDDKHISITNDITKTFALGICKGLQYCHTNSILHLDVKPNNILVCENNICKLCDFGNSVDVNNINETYQHQGTVAFTAPEILMGRQATAKCDIYSLGIVFWQLRYRSPPYEMVDEPEVIIYKVVKFNLRPTSLSQDSIIDQYAALYIRCWNSNPNGRPDISLIIDELQSLKS